MIKALSLFSGGLDSILATRLVMDQGVAVEAIQFVTPFFNYPLLADPAAHARQILAHYGITVRLVDLSDGYLRLLHQPAHGFGRHFNPCIDCKILMFSRAREMLAERDASFLISGEVLGQRPMSQRLDTLHLISRDSATRALLLRPLSAQLLPETEVERRGWVDRRRLLRLHGRTRSGQMALAAQLGITEIPAPAGGCILADPILSRRIAAIYAGESALDAAEISVEDIRTLLVGRQFRLPGGGWLVVGRDQKDNQRLLDCAGPDDAVLLMADWAGPVALLKKAASHYRAPEELARDLDRAAALVVRYGRRLPAGMVGREVGCSLAGRHRLLFARPLVDEQFRNWILS